MNNSLVCFYDPFAYSQTIYTKTADGSKILRRKTVNNDSLAKAIVDVCAEENIDIVYLYGTDIFLEKVKHEVENYAIQNYNKAIKIGVNRNEILD